MILSLFLPQTIVQPRGFGFRALLITYTKPDPTEGGWVAGGWVGSGGWVHLQGTAGCTAPLPGVAGQLEPRLWEHAGAQQHFSFPKASAKGSSSNCVAHTTQHYTTQHHTTARHTPARPTTAPHTTARHTPQQDATHHSKTYTAARRTPPQPWTATTHPTPPDRLIIFLLYS